MNYIKPTVINNNNLAEGVYASSGAVNDTCYTVQARIHQRPETGRDDYRIQVNAQHNANHKCDGQLLTIHFNQPVQYISSNGTLVDNGGNYVTIEYHYWNNPIDNIGLGDVVVKSTDGLTITWCTMTDRQWQK